MIKNDYYIFYWNVLSGIKSTYSVLGQVVFDFVLICPNKQVA
jgi:hypothetical protein